MTAAETASATDQTPPRNFVETTGKEDSSRQSVTKRLAAIEQFDRALARERPGLSKAVRRLPFVDALGKSLAIKQFWLPDLTINYNFRQVARFDRCTTCHQGIDKLRPDEPLTPAYPAEEILRVSLPTPKQAPQIEEDAEGRKIEPSLAGVYGFSLAPYGILKPAAVTIGPVLPRTAAANAGLRAGNVILRINETDAANCENARSLLLGAVPWGKPARARDPARTAASLQHASAARLVRRLEQSSPRGPVRLYDLPRRPRGGYGLQFRVAFAERPDRAGSVAQRVRMVLERTLGLSHAARPVCPEQLPEVPS